METSEQGIIAATGGQHVHDGAIILLHVVDDLKHDTAEMSDVRQQTNRKNYLTQLACTCLDKTHLVIYKQTNHFIVHPKVDQRAGQLSLPHVEMTKIEKIELKRKTDEHINPVNGLETWDQSNKQKRTKVRIKFSEKVGFELSEWVSRV